MDPRIPSSLEKAYAQCQKMAFGLSEEGTDEEVQNLLVPSSQVPGVGNLFESKVLPPFVSILDPDFESSPD